MLLLMQKAFCIVETGIPVILIEISKFWVFFTTSNVV